MSESSIERDSFTVSCYHAEPSSVRNLYILTQPSRTMLGNLDTQLHEYVTEPVRQVSPKPRLWEYHSHSTETDWPDNKVHILIWRPPGMLSAWQEEGREEEVKIGREDIFVDQFK